jgi:hypothetical protein
LLVLRIYTGHYIPQYANASQENSYTNSSLFQNFGTPLLKRNGLSAKKPRPSLPTVEVGLRGIGEDAKGPRPQERSVASPSPSTSANHLKQAKG